MPSHLRERIDEAMFKEFLGGSINGDKLRTFSRGGVHPNDMKESTCKKAIVDLPAPDVLVFPLSQHIGAPAVPCVKRGDKVLMGQKIADAGGFVSANIHSSVSGTVTAVEPRMHPSGVLVDSIVIENDHEDTIDPSIAGNEDFESLSPKEIVDIVRAAGIVGMGGATFPTHVKLSPPPDKKIEYVIINGAECEPYLTSDHRVLLESPEEVIGGLKILMRIFGLNEGYIGIEQNKANAIKRLQGLALYEKKYLIRVVPLITKYPQGSEKQLIEAVSKRRVPPGKLPMDVGAVVDNVDTCAAIYRAVTKGMPLISRIVTVSGDCVKEPSNFRVRIGTPFEEVFRGAGGFVKTPSKIIMGGPMMGMAMPSLNIPVIKGTSGLLAFDEEAAQLPKQSACLRCGKCISACPMSLLPNVFNAFSVLGDMEKLEKNHIMDCIECGACTFTCPAKKPIVQNIKASKAKIRAAAAKSKAEAEKKAKAEEAKAKTDAASGETEKAAKVAESKKE